MKKNYLLPILLFVGYAFSAQVGINTTDPKATLDVRRATSSTTPDGIIPPRLTGDQLKALSTSYNVDQDGAIVYVTQPVTTQDNPKTQDVKTSGFFIYNANFTHPIGTVPPIGVWNKVATEETGFASSVYSSTVKGGLSLLGISLLGGQSTIPITANTSSGVTVHIPSVQVNSSTGAYVVPSSGIYKVTYHYKEEGVLAAGVVSLSSSNIRKITGGVTTILETTPFTLLTASLFPETKIEKLYNLQAGDQLLFGQVKPLLGINLLTEATAEITIYKLR